MRCRMGKAGAALMSGLAFFLALQGTGDSGPQPEEYKLGRPTAPRTYSVKFQPTEQLSAVPQRSTQNFSMVAVTWSDPRAPLAGAIEVRTRSADTKVWSEWLRLEGLPAHTEDEAVRGGSHPLWVGRSDGVEARVHTNTKTPVPAGLRLELVNPGTSTTVQIAAWEKAAQAMTSPAVSPQGGAPSHRILDGTPRPQPRPPIISRAGWGADETVSTDEPRYIPAHGIKAVVIHHTAESSDYTCAESAKIIRSIYLYHVEQLGWRDIGYNFIVDKCGNIYEGRKGGADEPVHGAHTYGFNSQTMGVAVLGTHSRSLTPRQVLTSLARLSAWKLSQNGVDPAGSATLNASNTGGNYEGRRWVAGKRLRVPAVLGHRQLYNTECPGGALNEQLKTVRLWAAGPVTGLRIHSTTQISPDWTHGNTAVTVEWRASTPASLISRFELMVDGRIVAAMPGTASSGSAFLSDGTHDVQVRGIHQSGKATSTKRVRVDIANASPDASVPFAISHMHQPLLVEP